MERARAQRRSRQVRTAVNRGDLGLSEEIREGLRDGLTSVRQEIATTRVEMLRWSFLFWIGQVAAMAGLLAYMLGKH